MNQKPKVDIVCLSYNRADITEKFIQHLHQFTKNFRLIIVDNGSSTKTVDFLKQQERLGNIHKLILLEENKGIIIGRNIGAEEVQNDYFVNLDNDQFVGIGWLEMLFGLIGRGANIAGKEAWQMIAPTNKFNPKKFDAKDRTYFPYKRCTNPRMPYSYIGCGGMLIDKKVYDKIGLFDEIFSPAYFEDPDFSWRAIQEGYKIAWQPRCNISHLAHQTISRQRLFNKNEQFVKSWRKFREKWAGYYPGLMSNKTNLR